jgi:sphingomyelin phosphodiesterase
VIYLKIHFQKFKSNDIFVDHSVWKTSARSNLAILEKVHQLFQQKIKGVPFYPIIGNHEVHPVNVFAPSNITHCSISTNWLYDYLANSYATWLPESSLKTVREGGYYTVLVKAGFRVVALNNNPCYTFNWWALIYSHPLIEQLQWLHDTLLSAEKAGEKVHILAHIPMNEGFCHKMWTDEYIKIIERFQHIIAAEFNGHTHRMEFQVYYGGKDGDVPTSVAWNGGSITTFADVTEIVTLSKILKN